MKICMLSTFARREGAFGAACRLHTGLRRMNIESSMIVANKTNDDPTVHAVLSRPAKAWAVAAPALDSIPLHFYRRRNFTMYSLSWMPGTTVSRVAAWGPDIVHLHWVNRGFLRIESLMKFRKPLVWTLHDMWPFTGGCHYSSNCTRYTWTCSSCPQLGSTSDHDLSYCVWKRKQKVFKALDVTVVAISRWLADCAGSSSLFQRFRTVVIPNGLDVTRFRPIDKATARDILSLPKNKKVILFGSVNAVHDLRKGYDLLLASLKKCFADNKLHSSETEVIVFGASEGDKSLDIGTKITYVGWLNDDVSLALLYSAADVMIVPSRQEAFGQTASEALSCGTPVVAFKATGLQDIVDHQQNGYLAAPLDTDDLARGILWVIEDRTRWKSLSVQARMKAEQRFALPVVARQYADLYASLLS